MNVNIHIYPGQIGPGSDGQSKSKCVLALFFV